MRGAGSKARPVGLPAPTPRKGATLAGGQAGAMSDDP